MEYWVAITLAFLASFCWGINAVLIRQGMKGENHFHALFIRSLFAFPILYSAVLIWKGWGGLTVYFQTPLIFYVVISATLVLMGDALFLIGLKKYSVNIIAPISSAYPLFTTITLIITGQEVVGLLIIVGTIIVIAGVAFNTSNDISKTFDKGALLIGVLAAMCWGVAIIFVKLVLTADGTDALGLTGLRMMILGLTSIVIYRVGVKTDTFEDSTLTRDKNSFKFMALSGFVGWTLGASLFFASVQQIGAAIPTPISSTNPIIASIISHFLGLEQVNFKQFMGIVVTVIGIVVIVVS